MKEKRQPEFRMRKVKQDRIYPGLIIGFILRLCYLAYKKMKAIITILVVIIAILEGIYSYEQTALNLVSQRLDDTESQIKATVLENDLLKQQVLHETSLAVIDQKARQQGMVDGYKKVIFIK